MSLLFCKLLWSDLLSKRGINRSLVCSLCSWFPLPVLCALLFGLHWISLDIRSLKLAFCFQPASLTAGSSASGSSFATRDTSNTKCAKKGKKDRKKLEGGKKHNLATSNTKERKACSSDKKKTGLLPQGNKMSPSLQASHPAEML